MSSCLDVSDGALNINNWRNDTKIIITNNTTMVINWNLDIGVEYIDKIGENIIILNNK